MTTKNIFKIHILFYIVGFICALTANFKNFIIFTSIIIVHETGHILAGLLFKWQIDKVILLPFGGITIFKERIDKPLYQEFIIAIMGPIFQIIFYLLFDNNIFKEYNKWILLFNLLPIYPLDGSKILNVILNNFFSFNLSHILVIIISFLSIFLIIKNNLFLYLIIFFILIEIIKEIRKHKYYFNKFLLERYMYNDKYKKTIFIKKIKNMKRQTNHILKLNNNFIKEQDFISYMFDK